MGKVATIADSFIAAPNRSPQMRVLIIWVLALTFVALSSVIAILAIGGRPDPPALTAKSTLLEGSWRFHIGDDPRWAAADLDDRNWETMDLSAPVSSTDGDVGLPNYVSGWMAHCHPGYKGYAWYRRRVAVPAGRRRWDILGPTAVDDGYEIYWNGQRLGGSGRLGPPPRMVGTRPMIFELPPTAAGTIGELAIRTFMQPGDASSSEGGGIHVPPRLSPRPESRALYHVEWRRTIAGYIIDVIEPLGMLAILGLALSSWRRSSRRGFVIFAALALVFWGMKRLDNAIVSWTDLLSLPTYTWSSAVLWTPLSLGAWTLAWNRWCERQSRMVDGGALALTAIGVAGGAMQLARMTQISRLGLLALLVLIGLRVFHERHFRRTALVILPLITVAHFSGELASMGITTIWFPFGIGVTLPQYAYAIAIPLLALLIGCTRHGEQAERGRAGA